MFERNCPTCSKSIIYKSSRKYKNACKAITLCKSCCKIGNKNPMFGKIGVSNPNYGQIRESTTGINNPSKRSEVRIKISKSKRLNMMQFLEHSKTKHGDRYEYSLVEYENNRSIIKIICSIHGIFTQRAGDHLRGSGCKYCSYYSPSKGEIFVESILTNNNIDFIKQKTFEDCRGLKRPLPFDFYLPQNNICIEFDGRQHFEPVEKFGGIDAFEITQKNDNIKNEYCIKHNIKLIRIAYTQKDINIDNLT